MDISGFDVGPNGFLAFRFFDINLDLDLGNWILPHHITSDHTRNDRMVYLHKS